MYYCLYLLHTQHTPYYERKARSGGRRSRTWNRDLGSQLVWILWWASFLCVCDIHSISLIYLVWFWFAGMSKSNLDLIPFGHFLLLLQCADFTVTPWLHVHTQQESDTRTIDSIWIHYQRLQAEHRQLESILFVCFFRSSCFWLILPTRMLIFDRHSQIRKVSWKQINLVGVETNQSSQCGNANNQNPLQIKVHKLYYSGNKHQRHR